MAGYAQHTYGQGGESIWIWDVDRAGRLELSSAIVENCCWIKARFNHTGVKLTFQRRRAGVVPQRQRLADLEERVIAMEKILYG